MADVSTCGGVSGVSGRRARLLILCEGRVTEQIYFRGVRAGLRHRNVDLEIASKHSDPTKLVTEAVRRRAGEVWDQVWCVFDVEAPTPRRDVESALTVARRGRVHCALSNPSFELWLALHFVPHHGYLTTREAARLLTRHLRGYRAKSYAYADLAGRYGAARRNAEALDAAQADRRILDRNPSSTVWRLVEDLHRYARPTSSGGGGGLVPS